MGSSSAKVYRLIDRKRGIIVAERVERAAGLWQRTAGLVGRPGLRPGEGLWLDPCGPIHTMFMRFPIDVLFLDAAGAVLKLVATVRPWRIVAAPRSTRSVVELPAGTLAAVGVQAGHTLALELLP